ncbi:MAG TPA: hypothetical protein VGH30_11515, partial [Jatrophihabitantaceae bacterium]
MSEILWLALPGGSYSGGQATLRVVAVPRLTDGVDVASAGIANWPTLLGGFTFTVETGPDPSATGSALGGITRADHIDPTLWARVFPPALPVRPYSPPLERRAPDVDPSSSHHEKITGVYSASAQAIGDPATVGHAVANAGIDTTPTTVPTPPAGRTADVVDFHRAHSLLREHPAVLQALGLILEFRLPPPPGTALIRVTCTGGTFTHVSPWTQYVTTATRFLAAPAGQSDLADGLVQLGTDSWQLATYDIAGGMDRLRDTVRTAEQSADQSATARPTSLPALRSAGLNLLRANRSEVFTARTATANAGRTQDLTNAILTADQLMLGYRVDVRSSSGNWMSLMRRTAAYSTADGTPITTPDFEEEGQVKAHGMTVQDTVADDTPGVDPRTFCSDEVVTRWDGWSLAVRNVLNRPVNAALPDLRDQLPFLRWDHAAVGLPTLRFGQRYHMRLRVADFAGGGLLLGDPDLDEAQSDEQFYGRHDPVPPPLLVPPDVLVAERPPTDPLGPGGSLDVLVIRSNPLTGAGVADLAAQYPGNDRRALLPPAGSFALAEQHGRTDGHDDPQVAIWLRRSFQPQEYAPDGTYTWLPDPMAEGMSMYIQRAPGAQSGGTSSDEAWSVPAGAWPDLPGKELVLTSSPGVTAPTLEFTDQGRTATVRLLPGRQVDIELTSTIVSDDVDNFEMHSWLAAIVDPSLLPRERRRAAAAPAIDVDTVMKLVRHGRHPMVSPPHVVRLVHAVQQPVNRPAGALDAARQRGDTFADIGDPMHPLLGLDAPSTAQVGLTAAWAEVADDQTLPRVENVSIDVARIDPDAAAVPPLRHEFGDTRHRMIDYTLTATSRYRQYFTPAADEAFQAPPLVCQVNVKSSARPPAPAVLSVSPAFRWTGRALPPDWQQVTRVRAGGVVRVELDRPWQVSGDGEQLAVLIGNSPDVRPYVSTAYRDPIWSTPYVSRTLAQEDFAGLAGGVVEVALEESAGTVWAVPFAATFVPAGDGRPARWVADVEIPGLANVSYLPFARLALARYQPSSIA